VAARRKPFSRSAFSAAAASFSGAVRAFIADPIGPGTLAAMDGHTELPLVCSARKCRAPAAFALHWNNPALHPPERRKTWLACVEHRASLTDFLTARGFLREVEELPAS